MVRAGGSASRTIGDQGMTDPGGGVVGPRRRQPAWQLPVGRGLGPHWTSSAQAFPPLGSHSTKDRGRNERVLGSANPMVLVSPVGMDRGSLPVVPQVSGARRRGRGMRPAGGSRPLPQMVKNELTDEGGNTVVRPLSVAAEEFSLETGPKNQVTAGAGSDDSGDFLPSHTEPGSIVIRCDAVVPTAAEAGAAALADIAGSAGRPCWNECSGHCRNEILGRCRSTFLGR